MEYHYYIIENSYSTNKQGLKAGVRIQKIPSHFTIDFKNGNGPFTSLNELKKKSTIYRNIILRNTKRAQQICLEKNIQVIKDFVRTNRGSKFNIDFIETIEHCTKGNIKNGEISGIHYYDPEKVRILKIIQENKVTGVLKAEIEFYDLDTNKWYKKRQFTTFFPKKWSLEKLFHECHYAIENKIKKNDSRDVYISKTQTGINVEIIIKKGKLKSIYPLI
ncbi:EndoU domain-containing protein [Wenyingzhuangia sp. 2_MG-2023]|uniref:EndoU domain-containing protein n=1 Tax=Wenyingzhuangia sp. 2_MG-2023 TaxID=3062639 RepID=UPI0026E39E0D|nr:EndoU domain-containing protein [Wenyingzhuangia sp. 2_MG-2023]MDO6739462.1 EndoU domain-containing protein [Wenyingzhuangia sp. 2_MG-2023]